MRKILVQTASSIALLASSVRSAFAQVQGPSVGTTVDFGVTPFTNLGKLITNAIQIIMFIAGLAFFIYLIIGGLQWITSGGDKAGTEAARNKITAAFIGLVIVVAAFAITLIVERVFGIRILSGFNFLPAERTVGL